MSDSRAAIRYAKAILDLAVENKTAESVENDMHTIVHTISGNKELYDFLASPVISGTVKKNALQQVFSDLGQITQGALAMLVDNKRVGMLREVAFHFISLNEKRKGNDNAVVTTALPLTPELEKKVLDQITKLTGKSVTIENKIDPSIIGGFVLRVGDVQYDASIANQLSNIKREFTNSL